MIYKLHLEKILAFLQLNFFKSSNIITLDVKNHLPETVKRREDRTIVFRVRVESVDPRKHVLYYNQFFSQEEYQRKVTTKLGRILRNRILTK